MQIRRLGDVRCQVGEGPLWDVAEQALYFVDLLGKRLWRYAAKEAAFRSWEMPGMIGSLALRHGGGALLALEDGFHLFDFDSGRTTAFASPEGKTNQTVFNDGKVDPRGRFLAGTQARSLAEPMPLGALYSLDQNRTITRLDGPIAISNGPCWSPDGGTFYFSDSIRRSIFAYDYDLERGLVANRRVFADTTALGGIPDGATVDSQGRYWVAICGGAKIVCYEPGGAIARVIDVPVPLVASVMFGGAELDLLYFTSIDTAAVGQKHDELSGALFVIEGLGARGLPEHRFKG